jgi:hypothetical protein
MTTQLATLTTEELEALAERATAQREAADDASVRTALQLFAEAAQNAARKLGRE